MWHRRAAQLGWAAFRGAQELPHGHDSTADRTADLVAQALGRARLWVNWRGCKVGAVSVGGGSRAKVLLQRRQLPTATRGEEAIVPNFDKALGEHML